MYVTVGVILTKPLQTKMFVKLSYKREELMIIMSVKTLEPVQ